VTVSQRYKQVIDGGKYSLCS